MEFDLAAWHREPASRWLVKLTNDRVYAGTIHACNEVSVVVHANMGIMHLEPHAVDWIRPLIELSADGWTVVAGFQPEDSTFDTWWACGEIVLCINYSAPTGFSDLQRIISSPELSAVRAPTTETLAQVRAQLSRMLIARQGQGAPSIAHLQ